MTGVGLILLNNLLLFVGLLLIGFNDFYVWMISLFEMFLVIIVYFWKHIIVLKNPFKSRSKSDVSRLYFGFVNFVFLVFLVIFSGGLLFGLVLVVMDNLDKTQNLIVQLVGAVALAVFFGREVVENWKAKSIEIGRPFVTMFLFGTLMVVLIEVGFELGWVLTLVFVVSHTLADLLLYWVYKNKKDKSRVI